MPFSVESGLGMSLVGWYYLGLIVEPSSGALWSCVQVFKIIKLKGKGWSEILTPGEREKEKDLRYLKVWWRGTRLKETSIKSSSVANDFGRRINQRTE